MAVLPCGRHQVTFTILPSSFGASVVGDEWVCGLGREVDDPTEAGSKGLASSTVGNRELTAQMNCVGSKFTTGISAELG